MTLKTGDIIQNRYRIVRLVGQGGFGAVYRAWDVNVSQPVALKENLGVDAEAQRQFEREATLLAGSVSYTHLRAHETVLDLVCRLLLEKNNKYI